MTDTTDHETHLDENDAGYWRWACTCGAHAVRWLSTKAHAEDQADAHVARQAP